MNQPSCSARDPVPAQESARIGQNVEEHLTLHSRALTGLFLLALFYILHLGQVIFLPMAIALLLAVLFPPFLIWVAWMGARWPAASAVKRSAP